MRENPLLGRLNQLHKSFHLLCDDWPMHLLEILSQFHGLSLYFLIRWFSCDLDTHLSSAKTSIVLRNMALIELLQRNLMTPTIILWQFWLLIIYFTYTGRHNNISWCISIQSMKVIVSTGSDEMSLILYSVTMATSLEYIFLPNWKPLQPFFWHIRCASMNEL